MTANRPQSVGIAASPAGLGPIIEDMLANAGSASHAFASHFAENGAISRETLADVLHHLSLLHGRRPSLFEIVSQSPLAPAPEWLHASMRAFARERDLLARLVVAAGPPPSRVGQTSVEETVNATRNALITLAGSDRLGCAIGAAAALLIDWESVGASLRRIGARLDIKVAERHTEWPGRAATLAVLETAAALPGGDRAVKFGFQTLLAQHFAFWNIVQTRAS